MSHTQNHQPLVSLVVPIYNVADYLEQCLASIQSQSYTNLEIICLNDGSTDTSLALLEAYAAHDGRVVIIDKENEGYGATCNRGIAAAHGIWVGIVEPDDYLEPTMVQELVDLIQKNGGEDQVDIARSAYWRVFGNQKNGRAGAKTQIKNAAGSIEYRISCAYKGRVKPKYQPCSIDQMSQLLLHHPAIWTALYRKEFLTKNNINFREVPGAGWVDNPFLIASHCCGARLVYTDSALYNYRENGYAEAAAFAQRQPKIPLERWNDMMDVVDTRNITSNVVLNALTLRGINYALLTKDALTWREKHGAAGEIDLEAHDLLAKSFERMDAKRVFENPAIPGSGKAFFAQVRGIALPKEDKFARYAYLAKEGFFRLKNDGIVQTLKSLTDRRES
ncbi:glycosyltransferase family 2 protein [Lancefieldella parvula]|uniref:glycosyltransferase family 2 protein n=1 Tax=Lancefieldella parvula TaxID=1382 RepID=UPI0028801E16|nr:glycosyltransferase [Lancefieldella parvula]